MQACQPKARRAKANCPAIHRWDCVPHCLKSHPGRTHPRQHGWQRSRCDHSRRQRSVWRRAAPRAQSILASQPPAQPLSGRSPSARVSSCPNRILGRSLMIPPLHPGGMPACSRWLSEATPPEPRAPESRTPAGVPAPFMHLGPRNPRVASPTMRFQTPASSQKDLKNPRNNTCYILKPHPTQRTSANPRVVGRVTLCAPLLASNHRNFPQSSPSKFLLNT